MGVESQGFDSEDMEATSLAKPCKHKDSQRSSQILSSLRPQTSFHLLLIVLVFRSSGIHQQFIFGLRV